MSSRKRITGRTGFDRQTKTRIDRRRREGATFAQIADELGMSSSSFYSIRKNQRRMGTRLQKQLIEASNFDLTGPSSSDTIFDPAHPQVLMIHTPLQQILLLVSI